MPSAWPFLFALLAPALRDEPPNRPALTVVAHRPDAQLSALLALFEGTSARDPADWLACWRRATGKSDLFPKAAQALIAALNPGMVEELSRLDGARFRLDVHADGSTAWSLRLPADDGTLAALATAMALTDGGTQPALTPEGAPVDRLDARGAVLSARSGQALAFASDRDSLARALLDTPAAPPGSSAPGWSLTLDPPASRAANSPPLAFAGRALSGASIEDATGYLTIDGDSLRLEARARLARTGPPAALDPDWLAGLHADADTAFAVALDPAAIDLLTGLLAAALPEAEASPRARLNALALAAGVAPELELWPRLRGASGFLDLDNAGAPSRAALILHARDEAAARRLASRVLPRLLGPLLERDAPSPPDTVGTYRGRPLLLRNRGVDVVLAWDRTALDTWQRTRDDPARSLRDSTILEGTPLANLDHLAILRPWPLSSGPIPADSPFATAMRDAPPLLLAGHREGDLLRTRLTWGDLRATVRRLVDATPRAPAPEPTP